MSFVFLCGSIVPRAAWNQPEAKPMRPACGRHPILWSRLLLLGTIVVAIADQLDD
jgi:hypothetical protein